MGLASSWEKVVLDLGVESVDTVKMEACQAILNEWLKDEPDTGSKERSWHTVLEALKTNGHGQLAEQLKNKQFGEDSKGQSSELSSSPGRCVLLYCQMVIFLPCYSCEFHRGRIGPFCKGCHRKTV